MCGLLGLGFEFNPNFGNGLSFVYRFPQNTYEQSNNICDQAYNEYLSMFTWDLWRMSMW